MRFLLIVIVTLFSCIPVYSQSNQQKNDSIGMFDLKYTLGYNLNDSLQVLSLWDDIHAVSTLQGVINRDAPHLYINYIVESGIEIDSYWWNKYRQKGKWLSGKDTVVYSTIVDLIKAYKNCIRGVVVYDSNVPSTSNVASSVAGIEDLIAVRYDTNPTSLYSRVILNDPKLPVKVWLINPDGTAKFTGKGIIAETSLSSSGSIKNDPYWWFIEKYMKTGKCNSEYGAYYIDQKWRDNPLASVNNHHTLSNHDFFVNKKAFFFDLSPWGDEPSTDDALQYLGTDLNSLKLFLKTAYDLNKGEKMCYIGGFPSWAFKYTNEGKLKGTHDPVQTEWEFSKIIGAYNAFKDADAIGYGALANASFWMHYPLQEKYTQNWVTNKELKERGYLNEKGEVDFKGRNFYVFYVGDYDASSWVAQLTPTIWDDKNRGNVPMMWAISPVLQERVPMALAYYRETATPNDYFVAADNGAGYLNPGMLQHPRPISGLKSGLDAWAGHCKKYYDRWDLTITGFVIDGSAPGLSGDGLSCYASFSPNGIVAQKVPLTLLHNEMPVLRSDDDVTEDDPREAAKHVLRRIKDRPVPFHWFRNILKTPTWYMNVVEEIKKSDSTVELLDAPTFFSLYNLYLKQNTKAAKGQVK
jgi:hypothetical protein